MKIKVEKPDRAAVIDMETCPIWEKEESVFGWQYDEPETCLLIEGEVTVRCEDGEAVSFGAGDLVVFPKGLSCEWEITKPVRKYYRFG